MQFFLGLVPEVYLPDKFKGEECLNHEYERWVCFMNKF